MLVSTLKRLLARPSKPGGPHAADPTADEVTEAVGLAKRGDTAQAVARLEALLAGRGEDPAVLGALGELCYDSKEPAQAEAWFRRALRAKSSYAPAHAGVGLVLLDRGDLDGAHQAFLLACKFAPGDADSWTHLGLVQLKLGNLHKAEESLKRALALSPRHPFAWNNLGNFERTRGRPAEAIESFRRAVECKPDFAVAHSNLGMALRDAEQRDAAIHHLREAVRLRPQSVATRHNLGVMLQDEGRFDEARAHLEGALAVNPESADTLTALGALCHRLGDVEGARTNYQRALVRDPKLAEAHAGLGELELWLGNFAGGWRSYENRLYGRSSPARPFPNPVWKGEPLAGRTLLVYAEQGLGDVIMFSSCLPDVLERAGSVLLLAEERLVALLARSFPGARVRAFERMTAPDVTAEITAADFQVPMGSLPQYFRNDWSDFPQRGAYLSPDPERIARWGARLAELGGEARVGLVWRGGLFKTGQVYRSLAITDLAPLFRERRARFVALQHGNVAAELDELEQACGVRPAYWREAANDIEDMAATIAGLDVVISACGSVVHLAGALDRPVWVLVPTSSSWRYLRDGERMPWYRSARLLRQSASGTWSDLVERAADDLSHRLDARAAA
jgi:Tfp pilus assembly protein PilF